ncbi:MAG: hypothetical protein JWM68_745, partial [Verrucomicrobiales bacterium]|nr:hypothetical protein [Verrucomicrobiales bacterium]
DIPLMADFSGDGKDDYAIFTPSTGQWSVRFGDGSIHSFSLGQSGDIPMIGKYNIDDSGTDAAVFRPSTGMWYVRFEDGSIHTFQHGQNGDISVVEYGSPIIAVSVPPSITTQPASQTVNQGANATFTVVATGSPTLTYQWRFNAVNISGATVSSYTRASAQSANAGNYSVVVANSAGNVTSANAALTVNIPPAITTQPVSQTVAQGAGVTFSVTATGTATLSYQWKFNGVNITGATTSSYTKSNAQATNQGNYSVAISNVAGSVTSGNAALTVKVTAIVDNSDAGFSLVGTWSTATTSTDKYGVDYRFHSTGTGSNTATWTANLPNTGTYNVYAWWSQGANRSAAAPYNINGGSAINKNQQANGGVWNLLGTFSLNAGNNTVSLSDNATTGFVVMADGVKWVQQ